MYTTEKQDGKAKVVNQAAFQRLIPTTAAGGLHSCLQLLSPLKMQQERALLPITATKTLIATRTGL